MGLETQLEFIQIIARHGDRTPMRKNEFYKSNETQWQKYGGYEMLTRMGIQHCYEFGAFLKNFYANFLGNNVTFDPSKVFIRTTFLERAIRSAKAVMAGIFNMNNSQPLLPMNISTNKSDKIFYMENCPRYKKMLQDVSDTKEYSMYLIKNKNFVRKINEDLKSDKISMSDIEGLADILKIENENHMKLPIWVTPDLYKKIVCLGREQYRFYFYNTEMARLVAGGIMNEIRRNFIKNFNQTSSTQIYYFSAHDNFLAAFLKLLNVNVQLSQPNFASAIVLELRRTRDFRYFVRILWKNNELEEPVSLKELRILDCVDKLCPLETFLSLTKSSIVTDFPKECQL